MMTDHSLEVYFTSLVDCAKSLMDYPDLQGRLLMFRYCFMSKPLFLMSMPLFHRADEVIIIYLFYNNCNSISNLFINNYH